MSETDGIRDLFGIIGSPVSHSLSPAMFHAGFRELGMDALYLRLAGRDLGNHLEAAEELGLKGFNVTSPYKRSIVERLDASSGDVVNTVVVRDTAMSGYNTDGYGALTALTEGGLEPADSRVVVLGAGGSAAAATEALVEAGAHVTVANRTISGARRLAARHGCENCSLERAGEAVRRADALISCISADVDAVDERSLSPELVVLDAVYSHRTPLVARALEAGCRVVDGRRWLLHQGTRAFRILTGREAPVEAMERGLDAATAPSSGNVNLIGPPGVGKSTLARELGERMGRKVLCTDALVEEMGGASVEGIFSAKGEAAFRALERRAVERGASGTGLVVDCGGGALMDPSNRAGLAGSGTNVLLWATRETLLQRIGAGGQKRPLLAGEWDGERLDALLSRRQRWYLGSSDMVLCTDTLELREAADVIDFEVRSLG